jgi:hypothetical protein
MFGPVQDEIAPRTPVEEEKGSIPSPLDPLQELLWNDLVGVDVRTVQRRHTS